MKRPTRININDVDLIVYDFDGVLTNNKVIVFDDGKEAVLCNRADGLAIQRFKERGISQIILSTEKNRTVEARARKLAIKAIYGVDDKKSALIGYCRKKRISVKKVVYVGNEINDLEAMRLVGYPLAPRDANIKVKRIAKLVLKKKGGEGVVKEIYDSVFILN